MVDRSCVVIVVSFERVRRRVGIFFLPIRPPPTSTLFPYTTLFRSRRRSRQCTVLHGERGDAQRSGDVERERGGSHGCAAVTGVGGMGAGDRTIGTGDVAEGGDVVRADGRRAAILGRAGDVVGGIDG